MGPKKPQVFTAPDGKQFSSKAEYRDYLMETFYSWRNKTGGEFRKTPGEIDGQVFDIMDSQDTTFVVMDRTEQVQIDRLERCKVFLGCCSSSIFVRDCVDCTFYVCCRQLRLRGVTKSKIFAYSQAEVHIEESEEVSFAPFNGGYPEQQSHFESAGMTSANNLWYDIFDHNDPDKNADHWSLLPTSAYGDSWWPAGGAAGEPYVPITAAGTVQRIGEEGSNKDAAQAGKAFSIQQMKADAATAAMDAMNKAVEELNMEAALLVMSAIGKGIDLSVWLMEGEDVPAEEFNDKFQHLALTLGIGEDWDTKQELDIAVAAKSLAQIASLFGKPSKKGVKCIDVTMFLNVCKQKVAAYLASMEDESEVSGSPSTNKAIAPSASATTINSGSSASAMGDSVSQISQINEEEEDAIDDELVVEEELDANELRLELGSVEAPNPYATQSILPDSPYDEEVAFNLNEDDDADTALNLKRGRRGRRASGGMARPTSSSSAAAAPEGSSDATGVRETIKPRPSSAVPSRVVRKQSPEKLAQSRELAATRAAAKGPISPKKTGPTPAERAVKGTEVRGGSFSRAPRSGVSPARKGSAESVDRKPALSTTMSFSVSGSDKENKVKAAPLNQSMPSFGTTRQSTASVAALSLTAAVEKATRYIVQSADLYHLVQVYLGFIDKYTLVPPRGKIVDSKSRTWLSIKDLQKAFLAARQNFSEAHVLALMKLVVGFSRSKGAGPSGESDSIFSGVEGVVDVSSGGRRLNSDWLKQYLVHLRLTKTPGGEAGSTRSSRDAPLEFKKWLGGKRVENIKEVRNKGKEFRKALAGRKFALDQTELDAALKANIIFPADSLKKEVSLRVQAWVLDIDGRKDFSHSLHLAVQKWSDDNKEDFRTIRDVSRRKTILKELKDKLLKEKAESLRKEEKEEQILTKNLFTAFLKYNRDLNYGPDIKNWGTWLGIHLKDFEALVVKSKEIDTQREKMLIAKDSRKLSVAPLEVIELKFNECCDLMKNSDHATEIRKCLVKLRKKSLAAGLGKEGNVLVTKALFDEVMSFVLAPCMMEVTEELRGLAEEARFNHMSVAQTFTVDKQFEGLVGKLFVEDKSAALVQGSQLKEKKSEEAETLFKEWNQKKLSEKAAKIEMARSAREEKMKAEERKKKKAEKAYKKWLKLRSSGKYVTKTADGKRVVKPVPTTNRVEHDARWSKSNEVEPADDTSFL